MALIGGVLAALRLMQSLTGEDVPSWVKFVFFSLGFLLLIALAASAAFATDRGARHYVLLLAGTLLIGGLYVGWDMWDRLQVNTVPAAWQTRFWIAFRDSQKESLSFVCAAAVGLTNCIALRSLGCRLNRPGHWVIASPASASGGTTPSAKSTIIAEAQRNVSAFPSLLPRQLKHSRRLLATTSTEDAAIAAPAIIGFSRPSAARGMAATL